MKIALVQIVQETDTFTPGTTGLDTFAERALEEGPEVLAGELGPWNTGVTQVLGTWPVDVELVPIIRAVAVAGPPLTNDALADLIGRTVRRLTAVGPVDGVALIVHGACIAEDGRSADAQIAAAVRAAVGPDVPISTGVDHHGHLTQPLLDAVDTLVAHRTQPHDLVDTGAMTARLLGDMLLRGVRPVMTWRHLPMVTHQEQYVTASGPMGDWFARARELERTDGVLAISLLPMQPWLDVEGGGWSVLVVADAASPVDGAALADELADLAWNRREEFMVRGSRPIADAVETALADDGLTLISDLGDSVFGGSSGESTVLLEALLAAAPDRPVLVPLRDPASVAVLADQAVGAEVDVSVGAEDRPGGRVRVRGVISAHAEGTVAMPGFVHESAGYGRMVLVDVDNVRLLLTERRGASGNHPAVYERLGVDVGACSAAVLKTAANIQGFRAFNPRHVQADTPGPTQSDVASLPWRRLTRPVFPLDPIGSWRS
jgi:microcystin degradation protein MlrC